MNSRELSEKLDALATRLESEPDDFMAIAAELRQLSNEKYAPGNSVTWAEIKPKSTNKTYTDKSGKKSPF